MDEKFKQRWKQNLQEILPDAIHEYMETKTSNSDGGGGSNNSLGERVARMESDIEYIKRDITEIKTTQAEHSKEFSSLRVELQKGINTIITVTSALVVASMGIMAAIFAYIK